MVLDARSATGISCLLTSPESLTPVESPLSLYEMDLEPPAFVTADATQFSVFYFDPAVLWRELLAAVQRLNPMLHQMLLMQVRNPEAGFDIQADIIEALGSRWVTYQPAEGITGDPPLLNLAFTVDLRKPEALESAFQTILAQAGAGGPTTVEHEGRTIYRFPQTITEPGAPGMEPCVAFVDGHLLVAMNLALAKSVISAGFEGSGPFAQSEKFRSLRPHVLRDAQMLAYSMANFSSQHQWDSARTSLQMTTGLTLPGWDVVSRYQSATLAAARWVDDGLLVETWQAHPGATP